MLHTLYTYTSMYKGIMIPQPFEQGQQGQRQRSCGNGNNESMKQLEKRITNHALATRASATWDGFNRVRYHHTISYQHFPWNPFLIRKSSQPKLPH
jgi:hypothetical protein